MTASADPSLLYPAGVPRAGVTTTRPSGASALQGELFRQLLLASVPAPAASAPESRRGLRSEASPEPSQRPARAERPTPAERPDRTQAPPDRPTSSSRTPKHDAAHDEVDVPKEMIDELSPAIDPLAVVGFVAPANPNVQPDAPEAADPQIPGEAEPELYRLGAPDDSHDAPGEGGQAPRYDSDHAPISSAKADLAAQSSPSPMPVEQSSPAAPSPATAEFADPLPHAINMADGLPANATAAEAPTETPLPPVDTTAVEQRPATEPPHGHGLPPPSDDVAASPTGTSSPAPSRSQQSTNDEIANIPTAVREEPRSISTSVDEEGSPRAEPTADLQPAPTNEAPEASLPAAPETPSSRATARSGRPASSAFPPLAAYGTLGLDAASWSSLAFGGMRPGGIGNIGAANLSPHPAAAINGGPVLSNAMRSDAIGPGLAGSQPPGLSIDPAAALDVVEVRPDLAAMDGESPAGDESVSFAESRRSATGDSGAISAGQSDARGQDGHDDQSQRESAARLAAAHRNEQTTRTQAQVDRVQFVQRISRAMLAASQSGGQVELQLVPAALGALRVQVTLDRGRLQTRIQAEHPEARELLLENLPQLRARLAEQGVKIERFDVDLMQQGFADSRGSTSDEGREQRQHPAPGVRSPSASESRSAAPSSRTQAGSQHLDVFV